MQKPIYKAISALDKLSDNVKEEYRRDEGQGEYEHDDGIAII